MALGDARRCSAKRRDGGPCRQAAMMNGRCRMHGGGPPRGVASPNTTSGRNNRDRPTHPLDDLNLLTVRDDIAFLEARIHDVMSEQAEFTPDLDAALRIIERIASKWHTWNVARMEREIHALKLALVGQRDPRHTMREVRALSRQKAALVALENKLLLDRKRGLPLKHVRFAMIAIWTTIQRTVHDPEVLQKIHAEFDRLFPNWQRSD